MSRERRSGRCWPNAVAYFGPVFSEELGNAQVWLNGERAAPPRRSRTTTSCLWSPSSRRAPDGALSFRCGMVRSPAAIEAILLLGVTALLFVGNALDVRWLAVAVVLAGVLWAHDLAGAAGGRASGWGPADHAGRLRVGAGYLPFRHPRNGGGGGGSGPGRFDVEHPHPATAPSSSPSRPGLVSAVGALGAGS